MRTTDLPSTSVVLIYRGRWAQARVALNGEPMQVCPSRSMSSVSSMLSICTACHWSSLNIPLRLRSLRIIGQEGQITKIELVTLYTENVDAGFCKAHMRISLGARAEFQYRFGARPDRGSSALNSTMEESPTAMAPVCEFHPLGFAVNTRYTCCAWPLHSIGSQRLCFRQVEDFSYECMLIGSQFPIVLEPE